MQTIWIIAKRELRTSFDSLVAYVLLVLKLGFGGFFAWIYGNDVFFRGQADLQVFFSISQWTLFFFIPAITMRMLAEEKKTGTIELLLTKSVTDRQLVWGKYLGCLLLIGLALLFTAPYYFTITFVGNVDHGATLLGYLGLLFMASAYIASSLFASSLTSNQVVAMLLALTINIFFHLLFGLMAAIFPGFLGQVFGMLSVVDHVDSISRGVLDSKDLIFFASLTALGLFLTEISISSQRNR